MDPLSVLFAGPSGLWLLDWSAAEPDTAALTGWPPGQDPRGQGLVEYALIILMVALMVFAAVAVFGSRLQATYSMIASSIQ
jgi:Flp pilus assembly pilin Flp